MTAIKNGVKTTLRTPGKMLLFSLILTALAVLLCISFCVFTAVHNYLKDCDDYYHTVVDVEFIGKDYPNNYVYDEAMATAVREHEAALDALRKSDAVIRFEPVTHALASVEGLRRVDKYVYDKDAAVFYIYVMGYDENSGSFLVSARDVLYSHKDIAGNLVMMRTASMDVDGPPNLNLRETYLICGHFFQGKSSYPSFLAEPLTFLRGDTEVTLPERVRSDAITPDILADYTALAESIRVRNNSCTLYATAALDDIPAFQQQELILREGRFFEPSEYTDAARVCILSYRIADALGVAEGDTINISVCRSDGNLYTGKLEQADPAPYTVVGIYERNDDYPAVIFVPDATAASAPITVSNGFRLGVFRVQNADITKFLAEAKPLEQYGFRFTAYDQGYSTVVEPMGELMLISIIFLAICLALSAGALSLQCYVFITRQRDTAQTMLAMGSGRAHIRGYFLSAAALLSIPAAIVGSFAGKLLETRVFGILERFAAQFAEEDLRFSSSRLTLVRTLTFTPHVSTAVYAAAAVALLLGVCLLTLLFCQGVIRDRAARKTRKRAPRAPKHVRRSTRMSGSLKYALLSVRRNPIRTGAVLLLCLLVALFFGRLTASLDGYRAQLNAVRENTVLKGHATDYTGRQIEGLVVSNHTYTSLSETGLLSNVELSRNMGNLRFSGVSITADGVETGAPPPEIPSSSFAIETMLGQLYYEPAYSATTSVRNSTVFYYAEPTALTWLDGFDEAAFRESRSSCVMAQQVMEQNGIQLGDTAMFIRSFDHHLSAISLRVVGSYLSAAGDVTIFAPLVVDTEQAQAAFRRTQSYDSMTFTLDSSEHLDALRDALANAGFSTVRAKDGPRLYAVIDDEMFLDTTHSMERQIKYVSVLYDSLYVLTGIIGFVLAWLLVSSRRKEIALLRALGTQPDRVVAIFFTEQLMLSLAGLGLGLLLRKLFNQPFEPQLWLLVPLFLAVWLVSTWVCLLVSVHKQAYAALAEPE